MKLYIKQKVFSWGDKFTVKNGYGEDVYTVKGEVLSIGRKLHILDMNENELAFIKQKIFKLLPKYQIIINGDVVAEVTKKLALLKPKYVVSGLDLEITGDFLAHEYSAVNKNGEQVLTVSKEWFKWGDTYVIDTLDTLDPVIASALLIVIDACMAEEQVAASAGT